MIRCRFALAAACVTLLFPTRAWAHPYASGITNLNQTISWVLNEPASDVKTVFDNGAVTNDLGGGLIPGTNTFALGAHTNFAIIVYKAGSNVLSQISSDSVTNNNFFGPRGVAVNKNPKTWNFGRIYVVNASVGAANLRPTTTRGIYVMDAASSDFLGLGNTAATGGIPLGASTNYDPYRVSVGPDDVVYVTQAGNTLPSDGGIWLCDPGLFKSTNLFGLAEPLTNTWNHATNFGECSGTPAITGSLAAGNLRVSLAAWYLNLCNPPGSYAPLTNMYNQIYSYNISAGPLPWTSFPTVVTNPIAIGTVNQVAIDSTIAPDGKYFICAFRFVPSDGDTNLCVLSATGATLWDSKSQSLSYFNDSKVDHLSVGNYSVAVSPDDKFVAVQGSTNNCFLLMALTNGVPDISTLVTNTWVSANGGTACRAVCWDAADNLYVTSGGSDTLRILSLGLTTTCITSNDFTCTNGGFQLAISSPPPFLIFITNQPASQTGVLGGSATFVCQAVAGNSLTYHWQQNGFNLTDGPGINGSATSQLTISGLTITNAGAYSCVLSDANGSISSANAILTLPGPPIITQQPTNQIVQCASAAILTVTASGLTPFSYQWFVGASPLSDGAAISGATSTNLTLTTSALSQSGSYSVIITNSMGSATSQVAVLTVIDTIPPVVTVNGNATTNVTQNTLFNDPGATASDLCAGMLSVTTTGIVNINTTGTYLLSYTATDPSANSATVFRTVYVSANNAHPSIVLPPTNQTTQCTATVIMTASANGAAPLSYQWQLGGTPLSSGVDLSGVTNASLTLSNVAVSESGSYTLVVTNTFGGATSQVAALTIIDTIPPVVTLNSSASITVPQGSAFNDPGASASDSCAGTLPLTTIGTVNPNVPGAYVVTYSAIDPSGNSASTTRTVNVYASALAPIWTLFPTSPVGDSGNGETGDGTRSDDIYFTDPNTGYASRDSQVYKTVNAGSTWTLMPSPSTTAHFRSISFLTPTHGFAGNLGPGSYDGAVTDTNVLYETLDGAQTWSVHQGLSQQGMKGFCAMYVYDSQHIFGGGRVRGPAFFVKSANAGTNWTVVNLTAAGVMNGIMDVYFQDLTNGWVCGMDTNAYSSSCSPTYHGCLAKTTDGGNTWTPVINTSLGCCYFWKMSWPSPQVGYVSLQQNGTIDNIIFYKTTNGGQTWVSNGIPISVVGNCAFYLQGIGFVDTNTGWMGGATCATYQESFIQTTDGGATWNPVGYFDTPHMNRLRFPATNWGYACGFGLHLYHSPLAITNQSPNQFVGGGGSVQLQAGVYTLNGPASYQWQLNGVNLAGATSSTLTLSNATAASEGNYTLVASNAYGIVSSSNTSVRVLVPTLLANPQLLPSGGARVIWGNSDGSALTSNDLPNFELDFSSNLPNQWQLLNVPFSLTNGSAQAIDPTSNAFRFYRVVGH